MPYQLRTIGRLGGFRPFEYQIWSTFSFCREPTSFHVRVVNERKKFSGSHPYKYFTKYLTNSHRVDKPISLSVPNQKFIYANPVFWVPVSWGKMFGSLDLCVIARETTRDSWTWICLIWFNEVFYKLRYYSITCLTCWLLLYDDYL